MGKYDREEIDGSTYMQEMLDLTTNYNRFLIYFFYYRFINNHLSASIIIAAFYQLLQFLDRMLNILHIVFCSFDQFLILVL